MLARHAETTWNVEGRQQGHLDSPLTPRGVAQATRLARRLALVGVNAIYSSDLGRARRTAEIITAHTGGSVQLDDRLREQDLGIFSGLTKAEIQHRHPAEFASYRREGPGFVIPGGESAAHRAGLAVQCLDELARAHPGGTIVVVAHDGVVRALLAHIQQQAGAKAGRVKSSNTGLSIFVHAHGHWHVEALNDVRHLDGAGGSAMA
jgi:broad specificity phosphatase PhoE